MRTRSETNLRNILGATDVSEESLAQLKETVNQFISSNDEVYTFKPDLTPGQCAAVHLLCKQRKITSKSEGLNERRCISILKPKELKKPKKPIKIIKLKNRIKLKKPNEKNIKSTSTENFSSFTFAQNSKFILQDLFTHYPPDINDGDEHTIGDSNRIIKSVQVRKNDIFSKALANKSEIRSRVNVFDVAMERNPNLRKISLNRSKLPIASFKDNITSIIESHQVVLISGATGCGKTTQVPQYLLDYMWTKGETCKIVCSQPRRISAISVAERISSERGEIVGDTVGYKIQLESKGGAHSSIVSCTSGILMRVLTARNARSNQGTSRKKKKDALADITHIIVDEIHERDYYSDFILAIIRDMLPLYPHLRLILMSATIDAERFANYFGGCPTIRVPGFTYPVRSFYLEDVVSIITSNENNHLDNISSSGTNIGTTILTEGYISAFDEAITLALVSDEFDNLLDYLSSEGNSKVINYQHSSTGVSPLMVFAGKGRVGDVSMLLSLGADPDMQDNDGKRAIDWAEREDQAESAGIIRSHVKKKELFDEFLPTVDSELVDTVLIDQLLRRICVDSKTGAVLIFLPGWHDIKKTQERLNASSYFSDPSKFVIMPLHSMVPAAEQKKVFVQPPPGCRKIVLSTNIAETAVTIDDVVYVIDSGRMKEKSYDPYNNVSTLQSSWISKASVKQRQGRAGRCQPGICYHLYTKHRESSFPDFQVPQIKRMPVEELCMQVKLLDPDCKIEDFLNKTLDPPIFETIRNAIIVLQDIGALSLDERLTELGEKLGSLPVHPLTSKMLLFAILLDCLDPALTLACVSGYRDPFTLPMSCVEKRKAAAARSELASMFLGHGDQLAVIAAFECWKNARERGQEARFCSDYSVSPNTMHMISKMRKKLHSELVRNGFIPEKEGGCSSNARDPGIVHSVLVAGLYPSVGKLFPPPKAGKRAAILTSLGDRVLLHNHSMNSRLSFNKPLAIYDEVTRGDDGLHIKNCCIVGPLPLLLLATEILVSPVSGTVDEDEGNKKSDGRARNKDDIDVDMKETNTSDINSGNKVISSPNQKVKVTIDRWLHYESTALEVAQIYCLRERLSAAILFKVKHPGKVLPDVLHASMYSIACILSSDGMSGVPLPQFPSRTTSMVNKTEINQSDPGKEGKIGNPKLLISTTAHGDCEITDSQHHDEMQAPSKRPRLSVKPVDA